MKPMKKQFLAGLLIIGLLSGCTTGSREAEALAKSSNTESRETDTVLDKDQEEIENAVKQAEENAKESDYEKALEIIEISLRKYPNNQKLKDQKEEYTNAIAVQAKIAAVKQAEDYAANLMYENAAETLEVFLRKYPEFTELSEKLKEYKHSAIVLAKENALSQADELISTNDYAEAIRTLRFAADKVGEDEDINKKLTECEKKYVEYLTTQINEKVAVESFDSAEDMVSEGAELLPDNETVATLAQYIENKKPTYLVNMTYTEKNFAYFRDTTLYDNIGNSYFSSIGNQCEMGGSCYDYASVSYYLGGAYTKFNLDLAVTNDTRVDHKDCFMIVGNEDKILYSSGLADKEFLPVSLEIDVTNIDWLRIKVTDGDFYSTNVGWIVSNPRLYKE